MEFSLRFSTSTATVIFAVVLTFLLKILKPKGGKKGKNRAPPQAKGKWLVIGHLHLLGSSGLPHRVLAKLSERYGPIFTIKLGVHNALVVSSSEIAKECFKVNDKAFSSRPKLMAVELMGYNYAIFALAPYGDYWRQVRKIIMLQVLSPKRVEMLAPIRVSERRASTAEIYEAWLKNKESTGSVMVKLDMQQWFGTLILNGLLGVVAGKRLSLNDEKGGFDIGGYERDMKETGKEMDEIFDGWLEEHKRKRKSKQQDEGNQVLMDVLISIVEGASEEEFPGHDHDTIIKATCLTMLIAGLETTAVTLTWSLCLLLNNPRTIKVAQDEIDEHVGRNRPVEESDLKNLVYIDAIFKETLRLYAPGPLGLPHETMEDCVVQGYKIPSGTRLLLNLWKIHRDPKIWPNPEEFKPERFLTTHKDIDLKGSHFELLPFGSGRRVCPGILFAHHASRLALATLIQQFEMKTPGNEPVDMDEIFGVTCSKATPLDVLLSPRLSLDMYPVGA
ncbi:unnamed protein product [Lactuca virosa]|uniref:Cytochrome P450 n=1 Tax=Lactuca virosa TaxID=75947 RepID=A0AAU9M8V7_9ASTR|nr:unnamed protein product [Lactuca virosa]